MEVVNNVSAGGGKTTWEDVAFVSPPLPPVSVGPMGATGVDVGFVAPPLPSVAVMGHMVV